MKVINIDGLTMILNVVRFARIVENETFYVIFKHCESSSTYQEVFPLRYD